MQVAILSDIHGNAFALGAVLSEVKSLGINTLVIAGDFVGYYYNPQTVLEMLKPFNVYACRGNHEDLLQNWCSGTYETRQLLKNKYGSGYKIADETLNIEQTNWLYSLPHPMNCAINAVNFCIAHGSPWDINVYIYENNIAKYIDDFKKVTNNCDVIILGHSHYQLVQKIDNTLIINPGSVGQPRSGKVKEIVAPITTSRAQWAILDTENLEVKFETTRYECLDLLQQIEQYDPANEYLKTILTRETE